MSAVVLLIAILIPFLGGFVLFGAKNAICFSKCRFFVWRARENRAIMVLHKFSSPKGAGK